MNTYEKIKALAPEGEAFDATAVNEGVWLTENHLANIETSLLNADTLQVQTQTLLDAEKQTSSDRLKALEVAAVDFAEKSKQVETLQSEVATLKAKPAGSFTETAKDKDEHGGGAGNENFETSYDKEAVELKAQMKRK